MLGKLLTEKDLAIDPDYKTPELEPYDDADDGKTPIVPDIDRVDAYTHDQYVGAQVEIPIGDKMQTGRVVGRKRSLDGEVKALPTQTRYSTREPTTSSSQMVKSPSNRQTSLLRACSPNLTWKAINSC